MKQIAITQIDKYDPKKYMLQAKGDQYSYWKGRKQVRIKHEVITHIIQFPNTSRVANYQQALLPNQKVANIHHRGHGTNMTTYEYENNVYRRLNWLEVILANEKYLKSRATAEEYLAYRKSVLFGPPNLSIIEKYLKVPKGYMRRQINGVYTEFLVQII